jgi:hypothetical protein
MNGFCHEFVASGFSFFNRKLYNYLIFIENNHFSAAGPDFAKLKE